MLTSIEPAIHTETASASPTSAWCLTVCPPVDFVLDAHGARAPSMASRGMVKALFDGELFDRLALAHAVGLAHDANASAADLLLAAYERFAADAFSKIKGHFSAVVWDGAQRRLLAARDPIGVYPLFYAEQDGRFVFSPSPERVVRAPGIPTRPNALALADWLCHRWPDPEETFFAAVKRVRAGHVLAVDRTGRHVTRYWDPAPPGTPVRWLTEDDLDRFDDLFAEAVDRCMRLGPSGIFLSGGLDSVSVAAVGTDLARRQHRTAPLALSLGFPGKECNEQSVQQAVAAGLGLSQTMVPFADAVGPRGLLDAALEMGRKWPQPMMNAWNPAYMHLATLAGREGRRVILTGSGGDEWLTVSTYHTADLVGSFDVAGIAHLLTSIRRSYSFSWRNILHATLWRYGVRPWITIAASSVAPAAIQRRRVRRWLSATPDWVAPDAALRLEIHRRAEAMLVSPRPDNGFYLREMRQSLDHPLQSIEMENAYEVSRRTGVALRHPFWDADLVDLLFRIPPQLLNRGGRTKGLVRQAIAKRFPDLGFDRHRKVFAFDFFNSVLRNEGPPAWSKLGGTPALGALGVVDRRGLDDLVTRVFAGSEPRQLYRLWDILHLEAWAQAWA